MSDFVDRVQDPTFLLDDALRPSLAEEEELRKLFAKDRQHPRLADNYAGLVDVFSAPSTIRKIRARAITSDEDLSAQYVFPLSSTQRKKTGEACIVDSLDEFKKNWAVFTEGSLSQLFDWNNVVAAGGSVLACLMPLEEKHKVSKRTIRKHYHSDAYPTSDVDLFLWGLNAEQAEKKIKEIYEAVRDSVPWDVTCIRTKHTISIHSQYPYRSIQIILRLYLSPAEILAGFDIDAPCCLYDGRAVYANPRCIAAIMRQCNTVDMSRRSPSYEVRLAKYAERGYEVRVEGLRRGDVDPTIYERSIAKMTGLARLLVLESLTSTDTRYAFLESRRTLRGRPNPLSRYSRQKKHLKGDLKGQDGVMGVLESSDYDVVSLHIPYGPGWDARRIDKLVYQTDLGMNSTFNPKNKDRRLHRHPAFFGTIEECMEDCCETCPEPIDEDERKIQESEDEQYIRGRVSFIQENPGRQTMSGSFNPIDTGEWSEQVYVKPIQKLFEAVARGDREGVSAFLAQSIQATDSAMDGVEGGAGGQEVEKKTVDLNQRDHVGRTCLHLAILVASSPSLSSSADKAIAIQIALDLITSGARITARLVDGRTPLHLAAQGGLEEVVKALLERSEVNEREEVAKNPGYKAKKDAEVEKRAQGDAGEKDGKDGKEGKKGGTDKEAASSEDDWSSHEDEDVEMADAEDDDQEAGDGDDADGDEDDDEDDEDGGDGSDERDEHGEDGPEDSPSPGPPGAADIPDPEEDENEPDIIDINLFDWDFGFTALHYAVLFSSPSLVSTLIEGGKADVKLPSKARAGASSYSRMAQLHPLTLCAVREEEDQDEACRIAEVLVKAGATCSTANDKMWTIFHSVVSNNRAKLLLTLLSSEDESAKSMLNFPSIDWSDYTFPVTTAISRGHWGVLAVMLSNDVKLEFDEGDITRALDAMSHKNRVTNSDVKNLVEGAYQPIETALDGYDDIIQLLLTFGAPVNVALRRSHDRYADSSEKRTILDWVEFALAKVDRKIKKLEKKAKEQNKKESVDKKTKSKWKKFVQQFMIDRSVNAEKAKTDEEKEKEEEGRRNEMNAHKSVKAYLDEVLRLLKARGAKKWKQVFPKVESTASARDPDDSDDDEDQNENEKEKGKYFYLSTDYSRPPVPKHLIPAYDKLYEACYLGNDDEVQRLCLPTDKDKEKDNNLRPLNVSVRVLDEDNAYSQNGYTPLFAAIAGGKWTTARLILSISAAQYKPDDPKEKKFKVSSLKLDESDSDSDGEDSDMDSDVTAEPEEVKFVDIATRPSAVTSSIKPSQLLEVQFKYEGADKGRQWTIPIITKAIVDNDLDYFTRIANLYQGLSHPLEKREGLVLDVIMKADRPEMLDAYIKRTGLGIDIESAQKSRNASANAEEEALPIKATNDANKVYLGLNVHGKKRADLAARNDPDAKKTETSAYRPLVWRAAFEGAKNILKYLASERVLTAYKTYASTHTDERATWLSRLMDLEKQLPVWLGWTTTTIGESPITSAIAGNKDCLDVLQLLFETNPEVLNHALHQRIKFVGYHMLTLAVRRKCKPAVIDFFLSKSLSPAENDTKKGWNIYHCMASNGSTELFKHLLQKLPLDVNEALLVQQTTDTLETPLHIAIRQNVMEIVDLIVNSFTRAPILVRDIDGSTALHRAVRDQHPKIFRLLASSVPAEALHMEDCVGNTLLDIISLPEFDKRLQDFSSQIDKSVDNIYPTTVTVSTESYRYDEESIKKLERELKYLHNVIDMLMPEEKKKRRTKLIWELNTFASMIDSRIKTAKAALEADPIYKKKQAALGKEHDETSLVETLAAVREVLANNPAKRQLIHVSDVQKSVGSDLREAKKTASEKEEWEENKEDGLAEEDPMDKEERELRNSVISYYVDF